MKPIINITWEYPPWVVGDLSNRLQSLISPLARIMPLILVVRADTDGISIIDNMKIYQVGTSIRTSPHVLAFSHVLNMDLLRGASNAVYDVGGASILHTHDWISSLAGCCLSAYFGIPLMISIYSTEKSRTSTPNSLLRMGIFDTEKYCFQYADLLTAFNDEMKEQICRDYGIKKENVFVLRKGSLDLKKIYERWLK